MTTATVQRMRVQPVGETQAAVIVRVDMTVRADGIVVAQYGEGWTAGTDPADIHLNVKTPLADMLAWFVARGWTVAEWGYGARAWLGPKLPVRTRWQIKNLRRELATDMLIWPTTHGCLHPLAGKLNSIDLAYCL